MSYSISYVSSKLKYFKKHFHLQHVTDVVHASIRSFTPLSNASMYVCMNVCPREC